MDAIPLPLRTEYLGRLALTVAAPQPIGALRIVPVTGGTLAGPKLSGTVVEGAAGDWLRLDPDGTAHLDVRLTLRMDPDGALLHVRYAGVRTGPPEVLARVAAGESVPPETLYFRTAVRFEAAADGPLAWLTRTLAVGVGQRPPAGPVYDLYAIA